jgi:hypothetical protein
VMISIFSLLFSVDFWSNINTKYHYLKKKQRENFSFINISKFKTIQRITVLIQSLPVVPL